MHFAIFCVLANSMKHVSVDELCRHNYATCVKIALLSMVHAKKLLHSFMIGSIARK